MEASERKVTCPHCGAEDVLSPLHTICSRCLQSLEDEAPAGAAKAPGTITLTPSVAPPVPSIVTTAPPPMPTTPVIAQPSAPVSPPPAAEPSPSPSDEGWTPEAPRYCPQCGYAFQEMETECPRCARMAKARPTVPVPPPVPPPTDVGMPPVPPPSRPGGFGPAKPSWPTASPRGNVTSLGRLIPFIIFLMVIAIPRLMVRASWSHADGWVQIQYGPRGEYVADVLLPQASGGPAKHQRFSRLATGAAERLQSACDAHGTEIDVFGRPDPMQADTDRMRRQMDALSRGVGGPAPAPNLSNRRVYCRLRYRAGMIVDFEELPPPNTGFGGMGPGMPQQPGS